MIKKYISNLQEKSHVEKSNFALLASLAITGVIATLWFLVIFANPSGYFETEDKDLQNLANSGSLFDVLKAGLK